MCAEESLGSHRPADLPQRVVCDFHRSPYHEEHCKCYWTVFKNTPSAESILPYVQDLRLVVRQRQNSVRSGQRLTHDLVLRYVNSVTYSRRIRRAGRTASAGKTPRTMRFPMVTTSARRLASQKCDRNKELGHLGFSPLPFSLEAFQ